MRRVLTLGGVVVLLAVVVWGYVAMSGSRGGSAVTVEGVGEAARAGDDAGYTVRYANAGGQPATNPQFHTVIRVGEQDFMCQGYQDPASGQNIQGSAAEKTPLSIPANGDLQVTIYCRIPANASLTAAQVLQRP